MNAESQYLEHIFTSLRGEGTLKTRRGVFRLPSHSRPLGSGWFQIAPIPQSTPRGPLGEGIIFPLTILEDDWIRIAPLPQVVPGVFSSPSSISPLPDDPYGSNMQSPTVSASQEVGSLVSLYEVFTQFPASQHFHRGEGVSRRWVGGWHPLPFSSFDWMCWACRGVAREASIPGITSKYVF